MMSNCSSEMDVIKTGIPTYEEEDDDDNTVLYAYEPNTTFFNNVIFDAIQNLDKKFDVIDGKLAKIQRLRTKSFWNYRKPLGFACKNYNHLLSKKVKVQKAKKKERLNSFSYPESYSPTLPVRRPENDDSNIVISSFQSEESQEMESLIRDQESSLRDSPPIPPLFSGRSFQTYLRNDDNTHGPSIVSCFASPGARSTSSISSAGVSITVSSNGASMPVTTNALARGESNADMKNYPGLLENTHALSSHHMSSGFATSSPVQSEPIVINQDYPEDPLTWSVDDVILFLNHTDPQMSGPLSGLIEQHEIDGKALLLLTSDTMIKYMGLKLGTVLKLCHYIEKLKEEKGLNN
ncbi:sex comb on midleg-like protein 1 isoform X2 [Ictidomys tridecemlineatus]|uniref:sex comb on midleg-like protein 1 isoform X3 n=1 Tax=Ictidomys tridecemlineatus TaxID=43179 RepID=UPI001A9D33F1|nr:sex comb on midleg-like protein 1 isoform X3 [Ictidomys tridecemlineatus]